MVNLMIFAVCECGEKILVVSDLRKMRNCINAHAKIHERNQREPEKAKAERCRIEMQLARKVVASIIGLDLSLQPMPEIITAI